MHRPRLLHLIRPWIALLLALPLAAWSADRPWRMLSTAHYTVFSQLGDRQTTAWAQEFDQFIASMSGILRVNPQNLPPLTVVLFAHDDDFAPYKLTRPDGRTANVEGQFLRLPTWGIMALAQAENDEDLRQTIFHEATHWLMSADEAPQPAWFSEGLAELLSTFEYSAGRINWAKPQMDRLAALRREGLMPLGEFLAQPNAIFDRDDHTERFYAQSWAFTHFLLYSGNASSSALLGRFLESFRTQPGKATVEKVVGSRLDELERQLQKYIDQETWRYNSQAAVAAPAPALPVHAPAALVEAALGFLALGAQRYELARKHAEMARTLDPAAPGGYEILAYLAFGADQPGEAAAQAEAALQRGTRDTDMHTMREHAFRDRPDATRQRIELYRRALDLNPRRQALYTHLAYALLSLESATVADATLIQKGVTLFPGDDWLRTGAAVVDFELGKRAAAIEAVDRVLRKDGSLDEQQREIAAQMRRVMHVRMMDEEVGVAVDGKDFGAARAAIERHRSHVAGDARIERHLQSVNQSLNRMDLMDQLTSAQRAGQSAQVRRLVERILALPDVPADLREYLQRLRR